MHQKWNQSSNNKFSRCFLNTLTKRKRQTWKKNKLLRRKPWHSSKRLLMLRHRVCNSNTKWCNNNSWFNQCTSRIQWCQMVSFNSRTWCSQLLICSNSQILPMLRSNSRPCSNLILWIYQLHKLLRCHRISVSLRCKIRISRCLPTSSKHKQWAKVRLQSSRTFYHHQWWKWFRQT